MPDFLAIALYELKNNYTKMSGRATRSQYWYLLLSEFVVAVALLILSVIPVIGLLFSLAYFVLMLGTIVPNFTITARRLHDSNKSAWWMLIALVPFVGSIALLVLMCLPSSKGANNFGEEAVVGKFELPKKA